jgi:predicted dehydrogenase
MMRWLAGEIVAVSARTGNLRFEYEVEDTAAAVIEFDCGALGTLDLGYSYSEASLDVFGTEGRVSVDPAFGQSFEWNMTVKLGGETTTETGQADRAYIDEIEDFSAAIEAGRSAAPVPGADGVRQLEIIEAIMESADCGERVELEE